MTAPAGNDAIADAIAARLAEAPGFFRGSNVRIRVDDGPLAPGCLARLDDLATQFELHIVEIAARPPVESSTNGVPRPSVTAAGSSPAPASSPLGSPEPLTLEPASTSEQTSLPLPVPAPVAESPAELPAPSPIVVDEPEPPVEQLELALRALEPEITMVAPESEPEPETRVVVGPVRSGVILEHRGHLIVFGDVNPGAEVRAEGNIVVLGRLRGTAHAAIGRDAGFILALRLQPQQLRIGRLVARASENDTPTTDPEIAHVAGGTIVVERYLGRLPNGLAASI